jgi:hypothetical protein
MNPKKQEKPGPGHKKSILGHSSGEESVLQGKYENHAFEATKAWLENLPEES